MRRYSRKQLIDYIVSCPVDVSEVYVDLLTTSPYCHQIEMALENVSKILKSQAQVQVQLQAPF